MDAVSYLREDLGWAHGLLELVMQDATQEQLDMIGESAVLKGIQGAKGYPW